MSASSHTKKCGVKRKSHKCGIGLCNVEGEAEYEPPVEIADIEEQDGSKEKNEKVCSKKMQKVPHAPKVSSTAMGGRLLGFVQANKR